MNTPHALQSLINELNRDIAQDDQSLVADYILITRSEDLNGDETVRTDIKRYTQDLPKEEAIEYRDHQVALHEMMISRWAPKALKGDYKAAMVVAKYDQLRTELLGTARVEDDGGEQVARDDLATMIAAIKGAAS